MDGWNKMPLGREVGLDPSNIVLDGDPALPPPKRAEPPIFGPCLLWANGWVDQDATWYRDRHRPRRHCVRWGTNSPQKGGTAPPPILGPCLLWPKAYMHQDTTWYGARPQPRRYCGRWGPSSPPVKGHSTNFRPMYVVAKQLDGLRCNLV